MPPYETLYIYEIQGHVPEPKTLFNQDFIGCWYEDAYSFLFFSSSQERLVQRTVALTSGLTYRSETVLDYKNWETGREFTSFRVSRFFIYPYWENPQTPRGLIGVKIDPGVVFGSGCHPTTVKCLETLCTIYDQDTPQRVLDLGCGTGILSIGAGSLGATGVTAVDYNSLSTETARKNVTLNTLEDTITVVEDDALSWVGYPADLVCANLDRRTLERILERPELYDKRWYILSGMVGTEVKHIKELLKKTPLNVVSIEQKKFWFTITAKKG